MFSSLSYFWGENIPFPFQKSLHGHRFRPDRDIIYVYLGRLSFGRAEYQPYGVLP